MPEKLSLKQARKALHIKGKPKITYNNIIDYVASGELHLHVRHCNWKSIDNIRDITVKNKIICNSDSSTDNIENIEIIRDAIRTKTKFKLILCEK